MARFQYSLGGLLVAVTGIAMGLGVGLQILASAHTLNLSATEWWSLGLLASFLLVLVFGVFLYRL